MNILYDGMGEVSLTLLKNVDTRERVLEYLAEVIKRNSSRSGMQVTYAYPSYFLFINIFYCLVYGFFLIL